jgi:hypothetical protein
VEAKKMAAAGGAAGGAAAAAAAIAQAIKASGAIVRVAPQDFLNLIARAKAPLVVVVPAGGFFRKDNQYLSSYKGLAFYAKSREPLNLPGDAEVVLAEKIWIPG